MRMRNSGQLHFRTAEAQRPIAVRLSIDAVASSPLPVGQRAAYQVVAGIKLEPKRHGSGGRTASRRKDDGVRPLRETPGGSSGPDLGVVAFGKPPQSSSQVMVTGNASARQMRSA
jgi:hypothetical protein